MSGAAVDLNRVAFRYRDDAGLLDMQFDLAVPAGTVVAIIGPSGGGKSSLLSLIAGFDMPTSGTLLIGGRDVTALGPAERPVSILFQDHNLFAHLDLWTNVALGVSPQARLSQAERAVVSAALERVGLSALTHRLPGAVSGGERQRAALARALVRNRPVLLLDEPFAALGPALRQDMLALVRELHRETGVTVVMVTHAPEDARAIADLTAFLDAGRIVAVRPTPDLLAATDIPQLTEYLG
jgi:thiamine transport system ATP-binding protein